MWKQPSNQTNKHINKQLTWPIFVPLKEAGHRLRGIKRWFRCDQSNKFGPWSPVWKNCINLPQNVSELINTFFRNAEVYSSIKSWSGNPLPSPGRLEKEGRGNNSRYQIRKRERERAIVLSMCSEMMQDDPSINLATSRAPNFPIVSSGQQKKKKEKKEEAKLRLLESSCSKR